MLSKTAIKLNKQIIRGFLLDRPKNSSKRDFGSTAVVAGSKEYTGAAVLATRACLRSGTGYTRLFLPGGIWGYFVGLMPEAILVPVGNSGNFIYDENSLREMMKSSSVAFGMGMGVSKEIFEMLTFLMANYVGNLVIDADGINSLAMYSENAAKCIREARCNIVLTPHVGEFSRLTGKSEQEILKDRELCARQFAKETNCVVLLKGTSDSSAPTFITDGEMVYSSDRGTPGMAKAGSGDVLSGYLAGLSSYFSSVLQASAFASYVLGVSAEMIENSYSLTASEEIENISKVLNKIVSND